MDREQARRAASRARALLLLVAATLAITVCIPSPATAGTGALTPAAGGGASTATGGSTRYVDPIFAGALAPTVHASYDPTYALNKRHTLTVAGMGGTFTLTVNGSTTAALP